MSGIAEHTNKYSTGVRLGSWVRTRFNHTLLHTRSNLSRHVVSFHSHLFSVTTTFQVEDTFGNELAQREYVVDKNMYLSESREHQSKTAKIAAAEGATTAPETDNLLPTKATIQKYVRAPSLLVSACRHTLLRNMLRTFLSNISSTNMLHIRLSRSSASTSSSRNQVKDLRLHSNRR